MYFNLEKCSLLSGYNDYLKMGDQAKQPNLSWEIIKGERGDNKLD